jgi:hypothetical protein
MSRRLISGALVVMIALVLGLLTLRTRAGGGTPVLTLHTAGGSRTTIGAGTPLSLEIFVNGTRDAAGPSIGGWLRPWHQLIHIEASRDNQPISLPLVETSRPHVREFVLAAGDRPPTIRDGTARTAALDGLRRVYRAGLAASPEATSQLPAGTYRLTAVLRVPRWQFWGWRGRAESHPLIIEVIGTEPAPQRLAATARFFFETRQFEEAARAAREWGALDTESARARMILGDALFEIGQRQPAREAYENALDIANARPGKERPSPILDRLDRLRHPR